jgi:type I restriction-modification system DNA methylase subunit
LPTSKKHNKPLFHEKTLAKAINNFSFPTDLAEKQGVLDKWIVTYRRGTLDAVNEISLHGEFLIDLFAHILGYQTVVGGEGKNWTLYAEQNISDHGGSADGALGLFSSTETSRGKIKLVGRLVAPIELKGAKIDLDRRPSRSLESPAEQGWRYANHTEACQWVIVSNYRELRLYNTGKTPAYYELIRLEDLADSEEFKKLYYLLCADNFLPRSPSLDDLSALDKLLKQSGKAEQEITKELYAEYKNTRDILVNYLSHHGPAGVDQDTLVEKAQKLLDRVLFIAFCEDRGLLPAKTIAKAHDFKDPYTKSTVWDRYKALFDWVNKGNDDPPIPGYNGGLFRHDPILDEQIAISDDICAELAKIARYDFDSDVSVDVLGHIFEQSVTDLEELKAILAGRDYDKKKGKRKKTGVFYTPAFITQYIVNLALGGYLKRREEDLRTKMGVDAIPASHTKKRVKAELAFYEAYRDRVVAKTKVLDPACGSGAFLIAAFDFLAEEYRRINQIISSFAKGQASIFDLTTTILNQNLYGVDLFKESVEITKLSLWLQTAEEGEKLTYLDDNIKQGNTIIDDQDLDPLAFDWRAQFPAVFSDGGFDVIIGNPPYVRQEELSAIKPYLEECFDAYDGIADLYVYFYERGVQLLKPGGVLSYIVTNKWLRSGYGENLRDFFAKNTAIEQIVDFGHAKSIFPDADVFPCIICLRKPENEAVKSKERVLVCTVPRERLPEINLNQYVREHGYEVPGNRYSTKPWSLEHPDVEKLMKKIHERGVPLTEFAGLKPYRGVVTGLNAAFLIDTTTKEKLVRRDPKSADILKPYLRGQDIKRWIPEWAGLWMIFARRGIDIDSYPAVKEYLLTFKDKLEPRPEDWDAEEDGKWPGRKPGNYKWYEIQDTIDYFEKFDEPKIYYQEIQFHSAYCFDNQGNYANNKVFFLPTSDLYILAILASCLMWWHNWRYLPHMKDEALSPSGYLMENLPIAEPPTTIKNQIEEAVQQLLSIFKERKTTATELLDWLYHEYRIYKPSNALLVFDALDETNFIKEVRKNRPKDASKLSPKDIAELKKAFGDYTPPLQARQHEINRLERLVSELVNQAYGLTTEEVDLMWKTAPPRMPLL